MKKIYVINFVLLLSLPLSEANSNDYSNGQQKQISDKADSSVADDVDLIFDTQTSSSENANPLLR